MAVISAQVQQQIATRNKSIIRLTPKLALRTLNETSYLPEVNGQSFYKHMIGSEPETCTAFDTKGFSMTRTSCRFKNMTSMNKRKKNYLTRDATQENGTILEEFEENGVKSIKKRSLSYTNVSKLNMKELELWINNVLGKLESSVFPKHLIINDKRSPLTRFGIDREMLLVYSNSKVEFWDEQ